MTKASSNKTRDLPADGKETVRGSNGRFMPGNSASSGRPKGLAKLVRAKTNDGGKLVEFFFNVFSGKEVDSKLDHRIEAGKWLADRGWGKAAQIIAGDEDGGPILFSVPPDLLPAVAEVTKLMLAQRFTE